MLFEGSYMSGPRATRCASETGCASKPRRERGISRLRPSASSSAAGPQRGRCSPAAAPWHARRPRIGRRCGRYGRPAAVARPRPARLASADIRAAPAPATRWPRGPRGRLRARPGLARPRADGRGLGGKAREAAGGERTCRSGWES